jgi:hypothetical protein
MSDFQYFGNDRNDNKEWYVAYTVLVGVILAAVMPFAFLSLKKASFGRDPARKFVPWYKASLWLFFM